MLAEKLRDSTGVQLELYAPPESDPVAGPVSTFVKALLRPEEFRRIRGLCGRLDELIELIHRDRTIRKKFWKLRAKGVSPDDAFAELGKEYFLSSDRVQQIVYPRKG